MTPIGFEEVKRLELDILSYFAEFCEKHNLQYFLAYGTLIGAIRHKGFIPWDDDIDLQMPRDDYNRLIALFNENNTSPYRLIAPLDQESYYTIVKIVDTRTVKVEQGIKMDALGIDIDIFALDGTPSDEKTYKKWYGKLMHCYEQHFALQQSTQGLDVKSKVKLFLQKLQILLEYGNLDKKKILKKAQKLHELYPYNECENVGIIECCFNGIKNRVSKSCFAKYIRVPFECLELCIPMGYDENLKTIYGDYMKLPPIEQQKTHHENSAYWKNEEPIQ